MDMDDDDGPPPLVDRPDDWCPPSYAFDDSMSDLPPLVSRPDDLSSSYAYSCKFNQNYNDDYNSAGLDLDLGLPPMLDGPFSMFSSPQPMEFDSQSFTLPAAPSFSSNLSNFPNFPSSAFSAFPLPQAQPRLDIFAPASAFANPLALASWEHGNTSQSGAYSSGHASPGSIGSPVHTPPPTSAASSPYASGFGLGTAVSTPAGETPTLSDYEPEDMTDAKGESPGLPQDPAQMQMQQSGQAESGHIPRPPNAFILFRASFIRSSTHGLPPGLVAGTTPSDLSRIAGRVWNALPVAEKRKWEARAEEALKKHREVYPEWRWVGGRGKWGGTGASGKGAAGGKGGRKKGRIKDEGKQVAKMAETVMGGRPVTVMSMHAPDMTMKMGRVAAFVEENASGDTPDDQMEEEAKSSPQAQVNQPPPVPEPKEKERDKERDKEKEPEARPRKAGRRRSVKVAVLGPRTPVAPVERSLKFVGATASAPVAWSSSMSTGSGSNMSTMGTMSSTMHTAAVKAEPKQQEFDFRFVPQAPVVPEASTKHAREKQKAEEEGNLHHMYPPGLVVPDPREYEHDHDDLTHRLERSERKAAAGRRRTKTRDARDASADRKLDELAERAIREFRAEELVPVDDLYAGDIESHTAPATVSATSAPHAVYRSRGKAKAQDKGKGKEQDAQKPTVVQPATGTVMDLQQYRPPQPTRPRKRANTLITTSPIENGDAQHAEEEMQRTVRMRTRARRNTTATSPDADPEGPTQVHVTTDSQNTLRAPGQLTVPMPLTAMFKRPASTPAADSPATNSTSGTSSTSSTSDLTTHSALPTPPIPQFPAPVPASGPTSVSFMPFALPHGHALGANHGLGNMAPPLSPPPSIHFPSIGGLTLASPTRRQRSPTSRSRSRASSLVRAHGTHQHQHQHQHQHLAPLQAPAFGFPPVPENAVAASPSSLATFDFGSVLPTAGGDTPSLGEEGGAGPVRSVRAGMIHRRTRSTLDGALGPMMSTSSSLSAGSNVSASSSSGMTTSASTENLLYRASQQLDSGGIVAEWWAYGNTADLGADTSLGMGMQRRHSIAAGVPDAGTYAGMSTVQGSGQSEVQSSPTQESSWNPSWTCMAGNPACPMPNGFRCANCVQYIAMHGPAAQAEAQIHLPSTAANYEDYIYVAQRPQQEPQQVQEPEHEYEHEEGVATRSHMIEHRDQFAALFSVASSTSTSTPASVSDLAGTFPVDMYDWPYPFAPQTSTVESPSTSAPIMNSAPTSMSGSASGSSSAPATFDLGLYDLRQFSEQQQQLPYTPYQDQEQYHHQNQNQHQNQLAFPDMNMNLDMDLSSGSGMNTHTHVQTTHQTEWVSTYSELADWAGTMGRVKRDESGRSMTR